MGSEDQRRLGVHLHTRVHRSEKFEGGMQRTNWIFLEITSSGSAPFG